MMRILNLFILLGMLLIANGQEAVYIYKSTNICARHKSYLCLSFDSKRSLLVLGGKKLKFEVETVERINLRLNRVYTYSKDKVTGEKVKSCLVRKQIDESNIGIGLAPCDVDDKELVLALDTPHVSFEDLTTDEFVLKEVSYLDNGNTISSPYCISASHPTDSDLEVVTEKKEFKYKSPIILTNCGENEGAYGQEFKARGFKKSLSQRFLPDTPEAEIEAEIGKFCLSHAPDLCLGMSLTNGTTLEGNKLVQVKNLTKNEAKNMHDLKMRWYYDMQNQRIATASDMDLCLEAVYNAPIGRNRRGIPQFDDVVHLGSCDGHTARNTGGQFDGLLKSENFYVAHASDGSSSYIELRTERPETSELPAETKCISIVKCVKHDNDHCTPYNSVPVFEANMLSQGAHARLKDCDSGEMISQRFFYVRDDEVTVPPTKYPTLKPTPEPTTKAPVNNPTASPVATPATTSQPTSSPTVFVEPIAPTPDTTTDEKEAGDKTVSNTDTSGVLALLGIIGLLCLLIILVALGYYVKNRRELAANPEQDENFLAKV